MGRPVVTLAPGVYRIPTFGDYMNTFVFVDDDDQVTLVDTGLKRAPSRIVAGLGALGRHPRDVTRILLTHAHFDHAGGAAEMVQRTGLPGVAAHEADVEFIERGRPPASDPSRLAGRLLTRSGSGGFTGTPVVATLHDGEVVDVAGGLRIVHTPGHTPGHVSLLHEGSGVLITGDAIFNMNSRMSWPFAAACSSFALNKKSAAVLGDLEYAVAAFTHGPEIRDRAREQVRGFLARRR
jgi:glyoxylase-like metal-dependent hydrolase (beta-lactamase superfamily II)